MSRCTFTARAFITAPAFRCIALLAGVAFASCADASTADSLSGADHGARDPRCVTTSPAAEGDTSMGSSAGSGAVPEAAVDSAKQSAGTPAGSGDGQSAEAASGAGSSGLPASDAQNAAPGLPSYEVPVTVELADFSRYQVESVQWRERNGERRLQYDLPADLIGHAQRVEFSGPATSDASWSLRSDKFGQAECEQIGTQVACHETLSGIEIDVEAVEARVSAGELDPGRLGVTRVFEADPIGILRFTVP